MGEGLDEMKLEKILCALDLSQMSEKILDYALFLTKKLDARLYLLHVVDRSSFIITQEGKSLSETSRKALEQVYEEYLEIARAKLDEFVTWVKERGFEEVEGVIREGNPAEEIVWFAEAEGMHLIVMGTRGWTGIQALLLGSTAERVVKLAEKPVLVVRVEYLEGEEAGGEPASDPG